MKIEYQKIWEKSGYNKSDPRYFNNTVQALEARAKQKGLTDITAAMVFHEVMMECANGKQYPLDSCPCGCQINKSGTAITHEMFKRIDAIADEQIEHRAMEFENRINGMVQEYVKKRANTVPKRMWRYLNKPIGRDK